MPSVFFTVELSPCQWCTEKMLGIFTGNIFLIYSSPDGHLGCFPVLAIVNSAAMNTVVHVSFQTKFTIKVDAAITRVSKCVSMSTCDGGYRQKKNNSFEKWTVVGKVVHAV